MKVVVKFSSTRLVEPFEDKVLAKAIHKCVALNAGKYLENDQMISVKMLPYVLSDLRDKGVDTKAISFSSSWNINQLYSKIKRL